MKKSLVEIIEVKCYKDNDAANNLYKKYGFDVLYSSYRKRIQLDFNILVKKTGFKKLMQQKQCKKIDTYKNLMYNVDVKKTLWRFCMCQNNSNTIIKENKEARKKYSRLTQKRKTYN